MWKQSTQLKYWFFTAEKLNEIRAQTNASAEEKEEKMDVDGEQEVPQPSGERLTVAEETTLRTFYESKLLEICLRVFLCPEKVTATAVSFFKRFFLYQTLMDYDPQKMMAACIYLACKTEEFHLDADRVSEKFNKQSTADEIIENELLLLDGLNFHLQVNHPFRPLQGFITDLKEKYKKPYDKLYEKSKQFLLWSLVTDAGFLFAPSHLALAALKNGAKVLNIEEDVDKYIASTFPDVAEQLQKIEPYLVEFKLEPSFTAQVKEVDKKLKLYKNPSLAQKTQTPAQ